MYVQRRHLLVLLGLVVWWLPGRALAWVETSTQSHAVTLDLERDGTATVAHEILLRVKGGPLVGFDLEGVDADAAVLPDATVTPAESGPNGVTALPLLLEKRDDGTLRVEIDHPKGVSRGNYVFKLRYRTRLQERELIRPAGSMVEVRWIAPRATDGIDSARVLFRLPPGPTPPRLPEVDARQAELGVGEEAGGVFLANLRRAADKDELEVIRPHVAKGEPVVWRVLASAKAFDAFAPPEPVNALIPAPAEQADPHARLLELALLCAVALVYAAAILLKWRVTLRAALQRHARPRALIPLPAVVRAALSGGALAGSVALAVETSHVTVAAAVLVAALVLAAQLRPTTLPVPRRPGRWLALSDGDAFAGREAPVPGRFLDAGTLPGFLAFVLLLGGFAGAALWIFPSSPYHALMVALGSACIVPLFCTGRAGELPVDAARRPSKLLAWLAARLREDQALRVVPWARVPAGSSEPDELRLLAMPRRPLPGLLAVEFGLEYQPGFGGQIAFPWVLVRAQEGSEAHRSLPAGVVWTRGRTAEERAAVIRPKLPTRAVCLSLLRTLVRRFTDRGTAPKRTRQPPIKLASSSGRGSCTAKPSMISSPAQAT